MRWLTLLLVLLAACSKGVEADLPSIGEARSLVAEWALVNELAANGKINGTYAATMRHDLRKQLETAASALSRPDSRYGAEIRASLKQPDDAPPSALRAHSDALKQIEDSLESV